MELLDVFILDFLYPFYCYLRRLSKSLKELASFKVAVVMQHFILLLKLASF